MRKISDLRSLFSREKEDVYSIGLGPGWRRVWSRSDKLGAMSAALNLSRNIGCR
jgi:hypothetical protein